MIIDCCNMTPVQSQYCIFSMIISCHFSHSVIIWPLWGGEERIHNFSAPDTAVGLVQNMATRYLGASVHARATSPSLFSTHAVVLPCPVHECFFMRYHPRYRVHYCFRRRPRSRSQLHPSCNILFRTMALFGRRPPRRHITLMVVAPWVSSVCRKVSPLKTYRRSLWTIGAWVGSPC
jgi:hypothetical protein